GHIKTEQLRSSNQPAILKQRNSQLSITRVAADLTKPNHGTLVRLGRSSQLTDRHGRDTVCVIYNVTGYLSTVRRNMIGSGEEFLQRMHLVGGARDGRTDPFDVRGIKT